MTLTTTLTLTLALTLTLHLPLPMALSCSGGLADLRTVNASWDIKYTGTDQGVCAAGCYAVLTNNGQCDPACNNEACGYDRGECCAKPTGNESVAVKGKFILEYYRG